MGRRESKRPKLQASLRGERRMKRSSIQLMWAVLCGALALNSQATMVTPGQFSVSASGAATYSIPTQVPPGIAGLEPKLAINYGSQSGSGPRQGGRSRNH